MVSNEALRSNKLVDQYFPAAVAALLYTAEEPMKLLGVVMVVSFSNLVTSLICKAYIRNYFTLCSISFFPSFFLLPLFLSKFKSGFLYF